MSNVTKLSFPGLGIGEFTVNSEAFSIFGAPIAWYALIICVGMIFAVFYVKLAFKVTNLTLFKLCMIQGD